MAKKLQQKAPVKIDEVEEKQPVKEVKEVPTTDGAKIKMDELVSYIGSIPNISVYRKNQLKRRINGLKRDVC